MSEIVRSNDGAPMVVIPTSALPGSESIPPIGSMTIDFSATVLGVVEIEGRNYLSLDPIPGSVVVRLNSERRDP